MREIMTDQEYEDLKKQLQIDIVKGFETHDLYLTSAHDGTLQ
jgi:hypothetical protein